MHVAPILGHRSVCKMSLNKTSELTCYSATLPCALMQRCHAHQPITARIQCNKRLTAFRIIRMLATIIAATSDVVDVWVEHDVPTSECANRLPIKVFRDLCLLLPRASNTKAGNARVQICMGSCVGMYDGCRRRKQIYMRSCGKLTRGRSRH